MAKQLMNVTARDPDLGEGGKVKYRLHSFKRVSCICIAKLDQYILKIQQLSLVTFI